MHRTFLGKPIERHWQTDRQHQRQINHWISRTTVKNCIEQTAKSDTATKKGQKEPSMEKRQLAGDTRLSAAVLFQPDPSPTHSSNGAPLPGSHKIKSISGPACNPVNQTSWRRQSKGAHNILQEPLTGLWKNNLIMLVEHFLFSISIHFHLLQLVILLPGIGRRSN